MEKIKELLQKLTDEEKVELGNWLIAESEYVVANKKFKEYACNGSNCPYCNSNHIVKIGKLHNNQRYKCKECGKNFTITTNTTFFSTKKPLSIWYKYIDLMTKKLTLREICKELNINIKTAFYWRHKILKALTQQNTKILSGIIEADETYFRESQKGNNHLTRKAHKSGKSKLNKFQIMSVYGYTEEEYKNQQHKRGLSKDLICVLTATDKNTIWGKPIGYGKVQPNWVISNLQGKIRENSTLVTDAERSYNHIKGVKHKKFTFGLSKSKTYNLGRIDSIHTSMKGLINGTFKGVATKYLEGYLNYVSALRKQIKIFDLLVEINHYVSQKAIYETKINF